MATESFADAIAVRERDGALVGEVHDGWDVFGIPHGGYLAALAGNAVLQATGRPDLFSVTTHYLRKAVPGPIAFEVAEVGASRRFTTVRAVGRQQGAVVLALMASVGDRTTIEGPAWRSVHPPALAEAELSPPAGDPSLGFAAPAVAERLGLRLELATSGFARGRTGERAELRGVAVAPPGEVADQLLGLVVCDLTPPAVWNVLGPGGWVPTVELTAHVRARPADGPLWVDVVTTEASAGFLEEDARVYDVDGTLVVQSRQLARWSQPAG